MRFVENFIVPLFYVYISGTFISWNWDASGWPVAGRSIAVGVFFVLVLIGYAADRHRDKKQPSVSDTGGKPHERD